MTPDYGYICKRLETIGQAKEKLIQLMRSDYIPDDLSKHNEYFDSEHELESDKLHEIRFKFMEIEQSLSDIYQLLVYDDHINS